MVDFCVGLSAVRPLQFERLTTGCNPTAPFADRVDYLRWLFTYASVTNLSSIASPGSLHRYCEASQILLVHDVQMCFSDDFYFLGTFSLRCSNVVRF